MLVLFVFDFPIIFHYTWGIWAKRKITMMKSIKLRILVEMMKIIRGFVLELV